jgi:hypothetical protein
MGFANQSWTAAMYIYAHDAVANGMLHVFNRKEGWSVE